MKDQTARFSHLLDPVEARRERFFVGDGEDREPVLLQFLALVAVDLPVPRRNHDVDKLGIAYRDVFDHLAFSAFDRSVNKNPLTRGKKRLKVLVHESGQVRPLRPKDFLIPRLHLEL